MASPYSFLKLSRVFVALPVTLAVLTLAAGEPYLPSSDDVVLVRLTSTVSASQGRRDLEALNGATIDPAVALGRARDLTTAARRAGDPRLLARAQQWLSPWWDLAEPPVEFQLERARIRQGLHRFEAAQDDVRHCLRRDPRNADAWMLEASIRLVRGDYPAVRHACLQLTRLADPLAPMTLSAAVRSLEDPPGGAERPLVVELRRRTDAAEELRAWAWTTLGEIQARLPDRATAERSFRAALELEPDNVDALACLADLLLDDGRPGVARELLGDRSHPALRLRLVEAEVRLDPAGSAARDRIAELEESFALDVWRGDALHQREHARFLLRSRHDHTRAFEIARANWSVQKEPADTRMLLEAAEAAARTDELASELAWIRRHQPAVLRAFAPRLVGANLETPARPNQ